jgi:hypothetical protein
MSLINFMTNFPQRNKAEWLKNIDNTLNINPVLFYEFFSSFRKKHKNSIELEFDGHHLFQPHKTAVDFTECVTLSSITLPCVIFQLILGPPSLNLELLSLTQIISGPLSA